MPAGTACHYDDMLCTQQTIFLIAQCRECDMIIQRIVIHKKPSPHTVIHTSRLIIYLFEHEMIKSSLTEFRDIQINLLNINVNAFLLKINDLQILVRSNVCYLRVIQIYNSFSVFHYRSGVTCYIIISIVITYTYHQGTGLAGSHQMTGVTLLHDHNGIGSDYIIQGLAYRLYQNMTILLIIIIDELYQHLSVCAALEFISLGNQLLFEQHIVLNNPIVNQCYISAHGNMRMGIHLRRLSMSGPACMGYPYHAACIPLLATITQIGYLALCPINV